MSGYLQRLVDRAQATPPPLRPSLTGRSMMPEASAIDELSSKQALPASADNPQPARLLGRLDSLPREGDPARRPPPSTRIAAPTHALANGPEPLLPRLSRSAAVDSDGTSLATEPEDIATLFQRPASSREQWIDAQPALRLTATSVDHRPSAPVSDALPERLLPRPARSAEGERLTPVASQPHRDSPAHLTLPDNTMAQREVHVSIGRIEVTALPQAMPPPPKTREIGRAHV